MKQNSKFLQFCVFVFVNMDNPGQRPLGVAAILGVTDLMNSDFNIFITAAGPAKKAS